MNDLPTREDFDNMQPLDMMGVGVSILNAWADGYLRTEQEWRDSLNLQAMKQQVESIASYYADEYTQYTKITDKQVEVFVSRILAAALGEQP